MGTIADRLNELKGKKTIPAVASEVGLGTSTLYNYLKGREPGSEVIVQFYQAMGVNERRLLVGEGPKMKGAHANEGGPAPSPLVVEDLRRRRNEAAGRGRHR